MKSPEKYKDTFRVKQIMCGGSAPPNEMMKWYNRATVLHATVLLLLCPNENILLYRPAWCVVICCCALPVPANVFSSI
jgi:hypothetical protein